MNPDHALTTGVFLLIHIFYMSKRFIYGDKAIIVAYFSKELRKNGFEGSITYVELIVVLYRWRLTDLVEARLGNVFIEFKPYRIIKFSGIFKYPIFGHQGSVSTGNWLILTWINVEKMYLKYLTLNTLSDSMVCTPNKKTMENNEQWWNK